MPQEASKVADPDTTAAAAAEAVAESSQSKTDESSEAPSQDKSLDDGEEATREKKGKVKQSIKDALKGKGKGKAPAIASTDAPVGQHLNKDHRETLLQGNPALKNELMAQAKGEKDLQAMIRNLSINEMLTGLAPQGKNVKDMGSHKFWKTQPVPSFEELASKEKIVDGPIKEIKIEEVPRVPGAMDPAYEWVTMDLEDEKELEEVYELLTNHYVEDQEAMFRFRYSPSFLNWALKAPGWRKEWHVGVRAAKSRKLVAFISAIPIQLRVRDKVLNSSEVNFLCVHKKLRSKRLTPTLIREITRRCYVEGVFQAVYTVGNLLPTPVSTCRYFHRALNWQKLYEVGFSPLPNGSTPQRQILRYKLPDKTTTPGLRPMEAKDVDATLDLLKRYLAQMDMAQEFTKTDFEHWMLPDPKSKEQIVWSYVVEDKLGKITDFVSFYNLESSVLGHKKHSVIKAAYLFYYATEVAFNADQSLLKKQLNALIKDTLILAKKENFDVFNALTLLDNPLFLEDQRFGAGDGSLHYYLYNYRAAPLPGGIDARNQCSDKNMRGVGLVML